MSNSINIVCALCSFAFGTLAAYINYHISRRGLNDDSVAGIMGHNIARLLVDVITLGITFLVCKHFELPMALCLIAVAIGMTLCGSVLLSKLAKSIEDKDGGE